MTVAMSDLLVDDDELRDGQAVEDGDGQQYINRHRQTDRQTYRQTE